MEESEITKALRALADDAGVSQAEISRCLEASPSLIGQYMDVSKLKSERTAIRVLDALGLKMKFARDAYGKPMLIFVEKNQEKT